MRQEQVRKRARRRPADATQDEQVSPPGAQGGEDCTATCDSVLAAIDAVLGES